MGQRTSVLHLTPIRPKPPQSYTQAPTLKGEASSQAATRFEGPDTLSWIQRFQLANIAQQPTICPCLPRRNH